MWLFQSLALWVWVGSGKEGFADGRSLPGRRLPREKALTLPLPFPPESRFPGKNMERLDLEPLGALGLSGYSSLRSAELGGAVASQGSAFIYLCLNFKALCIPL